MSPVPPVLWHYTTPETFEALGEAGMLHPAVHLVTAKDLPRSPLNRAENMAKQLIWLTDLEEMDCVALRLPTGRLYHRYQVAPGGPPVTPWRLVRTGWPDVIVEELESAGTAPEHWYVTRGPVPVIYSSYDYC